MALVKIAEQIIVALVDLWRRRRWTRPRLRTIDRYAARSQVPASLPRRAVAVVGDPPAWAMFACPCGNGHDIMVRLAAHPRVSHWSIHETPHGPSLSPSIDSISDGLRCHFWLRNGQIQWVQ